MTDVVARYWQATSPAQERREDGLALIAARYQEGVGFDGLRKEFRCGTLMIRRALAENGVPMRYTHKSPEKPAPVEPVNEVAAVVAMLGDVLPEEARVVAKNPATIIPWVKQAVCPYARVVIWLGPPRVGYDIDDATFCARECDGGCGHAPGMMREAAFRAYIAQQVRAWRAHRERDARIAARRYDMQEAGEVMLEPVEVRL